MRPIDRSIEDKVVELYERGVAGTSIVKQLGVPASTVYRVLKRRNVAIEYENVRRKRLKFDDATAENIVAEYKSGAGSKELAAKHQCSTWCIREVVRRSGRGVRKRGASNKELPDQVIDRMVSRYQDGESQNAIAISLGISQVLVSRILRGRGIEPRHRKAVGERHGFWKGGEVRTSGGYVMVKLERDDPLFCMAQRGGYAMKHRVVVARLLGRPLTDHETVHHIDGDRGSNEPFNLQLRQGNHGNGVRWCCADCGSFNLKCVQLD